MGVRAARGGGLPAEVRTRLLFILGRFRPQPFGGGFGDWEPGFPIRARGGGSWAVRPLPERRPKSLPSPISTASLAAAGYRPAVGAYLLAIEEAVEVNIEGNRVYC